MERTVESGNRAMWNVEPGRTGRDGKGTEIGEADTRKVNGMGNIWQCLLLGHHGEWNAGLLSDCTRSNHRYSAL